MVDSTQLEEPRFHGSLEPRSWERHQATVPKAGDAIEVLDHDLRIVDRKLFNVMLAHSFDVLKEDPERTFFATAAQLKRAIGWEHKNGNKEIGDALLRLQRTVVIVGYWAGEERSRRLNLLNMSDVANRGGGYVYWQFNKQMAPLLADPESYVNIHLKVSAALPSLFAHRLYEQIAYHARNGEPWLVSTDELRRRLGATAPAYQSFKKFAGRVLRPALRNLDEHGPFDIDTRFHRDSQNFVTSIEFRASLRAGWIEERSRPLVVGVSTDSESEVHRIVTDTPDAEDVDGPRKRITRPTIDRMCREFPAFDVDALVDEWAHWRARTGGLIRTAKPGADLANYVYANYGPAKGLEGATAQQAVDALVPERGDDLRLALDVAAQMHAQKRKTWMAMARRIRPGTKTPSMGMEGLLHWVPAVVDQMKLCRLIETPDTPDVCARAATDFELQG
ncbi:hypothetical protein CKO28_08980 [Rhodovibrio sodomensis]|uniref:Initiator Rep protein WH1 domain-containing protein n=1 Tax=Rhodovibrio sodomensis TaxID=1088 RepID=A0ABS1DCK9_9PROT|nr:replication initiation protein [Rhodovibrio sodomensis]MBK1668169.1 hypothetical protein [Rhodovibrio sodomensis]